MSERPVHHRPRRLADWLNPTGAKKVHSLMDKVYKRRNLEIAWERVKAQPGRRWRGWAEHRGFREAGWMSNWIDCMRSSRANLSTAAGAASSIPKAGKPGEFRPLGIPTIYDRVCQQALLNRLEPIFEPVFDDANFGYRRGRSTKDALRKIWKEIQSGAGVDRRCRPEGFLRVGRITRNS